ncbi:MAG: DUF5686 family protein [Bacteroidetes bacterium]|nr:DUF5686 family protein [Bacteroidota bacterium]
MTRAIRILFLSLLIFFSNHGFSQEAYTVSGKVIDSKTRGPLAFVNIVINNSQYGGTTDIDGKFRLRYSKPIQKLQLSYVGYVPLTYPISNKTDNLVITLTRTEIELTEVEILPGINPAHRIIRNAIDNRDRNDPEKLSTFSYTSYDKTVFSAESDTSLNKEFKDTITSGDKNAFISFEVREADSTGKDSKRKDSTRNDSVEKLMNKILQQQYLFLMENVTKRKFMAPERNYNQVIATRMSGFKDPIFVFLTTQIQSFSFYKSFITIFQSTYVNPISPGSLGKYFFKLEDTTFMGKDTVFIISFRPRKGTNFDGMKGIISINTNGWAIQNVIAEPNQATGGLQIKIQQLYQLVDGEHWFPVQLNTDVTFKMIEVGKYRAIAKGRSYIRDIVLNPEMVRREFNHLDVEVEKAATERTEDYWNQYRVDSLTLKDRKTYHVIDSLGKEANLDKMAKSLKTILSGRIPFKIVDIDLSRILGYNYYEGLILGLGLHTNDKVSKWFKIGGFYQYAFAISTSKYGGDASFLLNKRNDVSIQGGYSYDLVESGGVNYFDDYNSILGGNFRPLMIKKLDRTENEFLSLTFRARKYWLFNVGLSHSFKKSTTSDFATSVENAVILDNEFIFTEASAALKFAYKEKFIQTIDDKISLGTNYPTLWLQYTHGFKGFINGEYDYNRYDLKIRKTFMIKYLGKLTFQVNGGYVDQAIPACNLYYGEASYRMFTIYAPNSFGTMRMNEFLSNKYASLYIYHDFGYLLFKGKKWFHPEFALSQNIGFGWLDHPEHYKFISTFNEPYKTMDLGYYESGLLVNNLVNLKIYTIGIGAFYRWGPYSFDKQIDDWAFKISLIFPF